MAVFGLEIKNMADCVLLITGNIGAGKTELGRYISNQKDLFSNVMSNWGEESRIVTVVPETIDPDALELFYSNRKLHTEIFEESCLNFRIVRHLKAKYKKGLYIFDRGMIEGAEIFCKNSFYDGYLRHTGYGRYIERLKDALDDLDRSNVESWLERLIVYLRVEDVGVLQERQRKRSREGEIIPTEYLKQLNRRYEGFIGNISKIYNGYGVRPPKVLTINASVDMNKHSDYHREIVDKIAKRLVEMKK